MIGFRRAKGSIKSKKCVSTFEAYRWLFLNAFIHAKMEDYMKFELTWGRRMKKDSAKMKKDSAKNELEICGKSDFVLSLQVGKYGLLKGMMVVRTSEQ